MIETEYASDIDAHIDEVWTYVQDIEKWALLFPGCRKCTVINAQDSRWVIKVGAGGLIKTVNVLVHIDRWAGPEQVEFSFKIDGEPVQGSGCYSAAARGARATAIALKVRVEGSGPMAPMWEAVSKPLLPQIAKAFTGKLKAEIETMTAATPVSADRVEQPNWLARFGAWLKTLWAKEPISVPQGTNAITSAKDPMSEQNKQTVVRFIEAMGRSDGAAAIPCLDPEAFTLAKGFGKFAGVRHYDTIVGTIDAFKQLLPTGLRPTIHTVIAEGDRVVVEFEGNAQTCDGQPYCNQYCMVFTLRDGRIRQVNEYFCTILADTVLWPLVERMQQPASATEAG